MDALAKAGVTAQKLADLTAPADPKSALIIGEGALDESSADKCAALGDFVGIGAAAGKIAVLEARARRKGTDRLAGGRLAGGERVVWRGGERRRQPEYCHRAQPRPIHRRLHLR